MSYGLTTNSNSSDRVSHGMLSINTFPQQELITQQHLTREKQQALCKGVISLQKPPMALSRSNSMKAPQICPSWTDSMFLSVHNTQFRDCLHAYRTYACASLGDAYGKRNCNLDNTTVEGRNESGRTISGPNTTVGRKIRGHCGSGTTTTGSSTPRQAMTAQKHLLPRRKMKEGD